MKYKYYVVYQWQLIGKESGWDSENIQRDEPITEFADVLDISSAIKLDHKFDEVLVISWQRYEHEEL
jgi:hypothetical protein